MFFILIASQELAYEMWVIVQYQQVSITFTSSQYNPLTIALPKKRITSYNYLFY